MSGKIKKFKVKISSTLLLLFLSIIGIFIYIGCSYYLNLNVNLQKNEVAILETIINVLTVIISVCGVNLLFSIVIEVNSKNSFISEIMANDVFAAPEFYEYMDKDKKAKIYNALEKSMFSKYDIMQEVYKNVRKKLMDDVEDYYYNESSYSVTCSVHDTYIEKNVTSCIKLRSFDSKRVLKNFVLGSFTFKKIENMESCIINEIEIDGIKLSENDYTRQSAKISKLNRQNDYNSSIEYLYNHDLCLTDDKDVVITIHYVTRTSKDDISSSFRVKRLCKNFSLFYETKENNDYRIVCNAYGFLDDADNSINNQEQSNITIKFSDWIFKYDGATVIILRK